MPVRTVKTTGCVGLTSSAYGLETTGISPDGLILQTGNNAFTITAPGKAEAAALIIRSVAVEVETNVMSASVSYVVTKKPLKVDTGFRLRP